MLTYKIYELTSPDQLHYIGQTKREVGERWRWGYGYKYNTRLFEDIRYLYSWERFGKDVICETDDKDLCDKLEAWFINFYNCLDPRYGYNQSLSKKQKEFLDWMQNQYVDCADWLREMYDQGKFVLHRFNGGIEDYVKKINRRRDFSRLFRPADQ